MTTYNTILFDLDGTLTDPSLDQAQTQSLNQTQFKKPRHVRGFS